MYNFIIYINSCHQVDSVELEMFSTDDGSVWVVVGMICSGIVGTLSVCFGDRLKCFGGCDGGLTNITNLPRVCPLAFSSNASLSCAKGYVW